MGNNRHAKGAMIAGQKTGGQFKQHKRTIPEFNAWVDDTTGVPFGDPVPVESEELREIQEDILYHDSQAEELENEIRDRMNGIATETGSPYVNVTLSALQDRLEHHYGASREANDRYTAYHHQ